MYKSYSCRIQVRYTPRPKALRRGIVRAVETGLSWQNNNDYSSRDWNVSWCGRNSQLLDLDLFVVSLKFGSRFTMYVSYCRLTKNKPVLFRKTPHARCGELFRREEMYPITASNCIARNLACETSLDSMPLHLAPRPLTIIPPRPNCNS